MEVFSLDELLPGTKEGFSHAPEITNFPVQVMEKRHLCERWPLFPPVLSDGAFPGMTRSLQ